MNTAEVRDAWAFVEPAILEGWHDEVSPSWRNPRGQMKVCRRLERAERRLGVFLRELSNRFTVEFCRIEVAFESASVPWPTRLISKEPGLVMRVYMPPKMIGLDDDQLDSVLRRSIKEAGLASGRFEGLADLNVDVVPAPLIRLSAIPHQGRGDSWSSSPDLNAYAKAARLISDLAEPWLAEQQILSSWPMLELRPRRKAKRVVADASHRSYQVPLPNGYASEPAPTRVRLVVDHFCSALRLRAASDQSGWVAVGAGVAAVVHLEPDEGCGWLAGGRVWVAPRRARPPRIVFDPTAADVEPGTSVPVNEVEPENIWDVLRTPAEAEDIKDHAISTSVRLATLSTTALRQFRRWWLALDSSLYTWQHWRAADIILGPTSDDVFTDFRAWVILQGREVFEAILKDPDEGLAALGRINQADIAASEDAVTQLDQIVEDSLGLSLQRSFTNRPRHGKQTRTNNPAQQFPRPAALYPPDRPSRQPDEDPTH